MLAGFLREGFVASLPDLHIELAAQWKASPDPSVAFAVCMHYVPVVLIFQEYKALSWIVDADVHARKTA